MSLTGTSGNKGGACDSVPGMGDPDLCETNGEHDCSSGGGCEYGIPTLPCSGGK